MARFFCVWLALLALPAGIQAQPAPAPAGVGRPATSPSSPQTKTGDDVADGEVLRITANLVSVPVTVINRQGQYVVDLVQNDFRIFEDGHEQSIVHFSNVDRPFSVALLIDTSGSTAPFLNEIKGGANAFVNQLRASDVLRPIFFHGEIKALTRSGSSDPETLRAAIDQIEAGPLMQGTRLYDAVDYGIEVLKPEPNRKAILLFTDGVNTWGKATMKQTLAKAEESGVIIYTLQYGDMPPNKYLQRLAEKTGGRYFKVGGSATIEQSFAGVAEELRRQYLIGYYPVASEHIRERMIKVKLSRPRLAVRARRSYSYHP